MEDVVDDVRQGQQAAGYHHHHHYHHHHPHHPHYCHYHYPICVLATHPHCLTRPTLTRMNATSNLPGLVEEPDLDQHPAE